MLFQFEIEKDILLMNVTLKSMHDLHMCWYSKLISHVLYMSHSFIAMCVHYVHVYAQAHKHTHT